MKREYKTETEATEVLKEALWLAWQAAGRPFGMGYLQDNPEANKELVWDNAYNMGDYMGGRSMSRGDDLNADYVFGRMLKLRVGRPSKTVLETTDSKPTWDYQAWCRKYPSYENLFEQAEQNVKEKK